MGINPKTVVMSDGFVQWHYVSFTRMSSHQSHAAEQKLV